MPAPKKRARARLAAPIVMTFASLGCAASPPPTGPNPPGPERPEEPIHTNPPPVEAEPRPPTGPIRVNPPPIHATGPIVQGNLPEPTPGASVDRRSDGSCWEIVHVECPPKVMCNPPPPHQVRCPPK